MRKSKNVVHAALVRLAWCHAVEEDEAEMTEDAEDLNAVLAENASLDADALIRIMPEVSGAYPEGNAGVRLEFTSPEAAQKFLAAIQHWGEA